MKGSAQGMCLCRKFLAMCSTSRLTLLNNYLLTSPLLISTFYFYLLMYYTVRYKNVRSDDLRKFYWFNCKISTDHPFSCFFEGFVSTLIRVTLIKKEEIKVRYSKQSLKDLLVNDLGSELEIG